MNSSRRTRKIYAASSWRNKAQPMVVEALRASGHEVYDFRNPEPGNTGFSWTELGSDWEDWTIEQHVAALDQDIACAGYKSDFNAMQWADTFVGVMPFGRSASFEMGWAAGAGKDTYLLLTKCEPELMMKMFDHLCCDLVELLHKLRGF